MLADNNFVRTTLITGNSELCKTFLFEAAISWAKEGHRVYYFASKQLESLPPIYHDRSEPSADALRLMTFIYTATYEDLVSQLVKLQTFREPPALLLVDDLDEFTNYPDIIGCSRELHVARCCAVLLDAAQSCSRISSKPIHVCATSLTGFEYIEVYRMYFDNRWTMSEEGESEEGRRVMMREEKNKAALEFCRLDDAVLVLRRIFNSEDEVSASS